MELGFKVESNKNSDNEKVVILCFELHGMLSNWECQEGPW